MHNAHFKVHYKDELFQKTWDHIGYKALVKLFPHLKLAIEALEHPGYSYEDHHKVVKITRLEMR